MSDLPTADQMTVTKIRERLEARGSTNNHAIARFYTYAPADIAFLLTQLSQVLRELEAARSHGSALLRDVEHAEAQLATALRELGEARADAENARGQLAIAAIMSQMLSADRDAALRSTAELTKERDELRASRQKVLESNVRYFKDLQRAQRVLCPTFGDCADNLAEGEKCACGFEDGPWGNAIPPNRAADDAMRSNAELRGALEGLKTAFRVNMIRGCLPGASHEEIDAVIRTALASSSTKGEG